jgi:hypothetical protein
MSIGTCTYNENRPWRRFPGGTRCQEPAAGILDRGCVRGWLPTRRERARESRFSDEQTVRSSGRGITTRRGIGEAACDQRTVDLRLAQAIGRAASEGCELAAPPQLESPAAKKSLTGKAETASVRNVPHRGEVLCGRMFCGSGSGIAVRRSRVARWRGCRATAVRQA